MPLAARLHTVRLLVCDVDGVLTDGGLWLDRAGRDAKVFSVRDGLGLSLARQAGLATAFLTARRSPVVTLRARECGVTVVMQGRLDKGGALLEICRRVSVPPAATAYVGDDLVDLAAMRLAGVAVAVADAAPEVKRAADFVTAAAGGHGAVREVVERLLKAQSRWAMVVNRLAGSHPSPRKSSPSPSQEECESPAAGMSPSTLKKKTQGRNRYPGSFDRGAPWRKS